MNKIVNGVANDYEFPDLDWVHHDSKTINENYYKVYERLGKLREENERVKEILKWKQNRESELFTIESVLETNKQLYDERNMYKSRCEKAIEYINKLKTYPYLEKYYTGELLNILQNGSDSQ